MSFIKKTLRRLFRKGVEGSASLEWEVIDPIAPAHYQFLVEKRIPAVRVIVKNPWTRLIKDAQAQVRLQGVTEWISISREEIKPSDQIILQFVLPLQQEKLYGYEEKNGIFELKCSYKDPSGKLREHSDVKIVRVLAKDDMIWSLKMGGEEIDFSQLIAAWITPRNESIQELIHESARHPESKALGGLIGYQKTQHRRREDRELTIPPGSHYAWKLHLRRGGRIIGVLTKVAGGAGNDINVALLNPDGMISFERAIATQSYTQLSLERAKSGYRIDYLAPTENDYYLLLDNHFSTISRKTVGICVNVITPIMRREIVYHQVKAIYETIQQKGFVYVSSPISYAPGISQRVQRPSDTIKLKGGNCLDASVLFASCFEAIGFDTYLILLPQLGHSLVAVKIWPNLRKFLILETTVVTTATFEKSLEMGRQAYDRNKDGAKWVSVSKARKQRIMPLT